MGLFPFYTTDNFIWRWCCKLPIQSTDTLSSKFPPGFESRFFEVPAAEGRRCFMFLDDLVRLHLPELFPGLTVAGAYSVKLTRDAELRIEDEFSGDLLEKIREALNRRATGTPSRLLYDPEIPAGCLRLIRQRLALYPESLIPGWRYRNFSDFFGFPNPGLPEAEYQPMVPLRHAGLATNSITDGDLQLLAYIRGRKPGMILKRPTFSLLS